MLLLSSNKLILKLKNGRTKKEIINENAYVWIIKIVNENSSSIVL